MKPNLKELLLASFTHEKYDPLHTRTVILNAMLFIGLAINLFFMFYNFFFSHIYLLFVSNLSIVLSFGYALYLLREKNDHIRAGYIGSFFLFIVFVATVITQKGENYTLIWTYFFAPFVIITLGAAKGLRIALVFIAVILLLGYMGMGEWQNGAWNSASYLRFVFAHILMLYIMYAVQNNNEQANRKIEALRKIEKEQLLMLQKLSTTDALTSMYNRRYFEEIFPKLLGIADEENRLLAFFTLDMDNFKQYNDTYGHQRGDWALIQIAELLRSCFGQEGDHTFRIGGEEFAGIIMGERVAQIKERIDRFPLYLENKQIEHAGSDVKPVLTCSIGAYIVSDGNLDHHNIYSRADAALYRAKAAGRNQVIYV